MEVVMDFKGFRGNNEAAVNVQTDTNTIVKMVIKPPCQWYDLNKKSQKTNLWLQDYLHGLDWNYGEDTHEDLVNALEELPEMTKKVTIYVKGIQKKEWLQSFYSNHNVQIVNLEDLGCPKIGKLKSYVDDSESCDVHLHKKSISCCAVQCVLLLKNWILQNSISTEMSVKSGLISDIIEQFNLIILDEKLSDELQKQRIFTNNDEEEPKEGGGEQIQPDKNYEYSEEQVQSEENYEPMDID